MRYRDLLPQIESVIDTGKAVIITGMRRVGKTTILRYFYHRVDNAIFIDLENPIERRIFEKEDYTLIKNDLELRGLDFSKPHYVFLDEIQYVRNVPSVMKFFIDTYGTRFLASGSASFYLKNLFSESLAGRKFIFELHPLSFKEFLIFRGLLPPDAEAIERALVSDRIWFQMEALFEEYLRFGGFPEVVLVPSEKVKQMLLKDVFVSFYQKEVLGLGDFRKNKELMDLMLFLMEDVGNLLDLSKVARQVGLSRHTVKGYIEFLHQSYFLHLVSPFSLNRQVEIRKMPKVYLCDCGLLNAFVRLDRGRAFEQAVFQSILPYAETINFYRRKTGQEIDFIVNKRVAVEVKLKPSGQEERRLHSLSRELGIEEALILTPKRLDWLVRQHG